MKSKINVRVLVLCLSLAGVAQGDGQESDTFDLKDTRVVGGSTAAEGAAPYQVSIRDNQYNHFCGGALISSRWILTAAHCVVSGRPAFVVVGSNTLNPNGVRYTVTRMLGNRLYSNISHENDIGLLQVSSAIVFNNRVQPIALSKTVVENGTSLMLTGWGRLQHPGNPSNTLQTIILKSLSVAECRSRLVLFNSIYSSQICTFTKMGEGACHGDSGGPLVGNGVLVGIVSWGYPCARGYPDVFSRVNSYLEWIRTTTGLRNL